MVFFVVGEHLIVALALCLLVRALTRTHNPFGTTSARVVRQRSQPTNAESLNTFQVRQCLEQLLILRPLPRIITDYAISEATLAVSIRLESKA